MSTEVTTPGKSSSTTLQPSDGSADPYRNDWICRQIGYELEVDHAEGIYVYDKEGNQYIDGTSGPFCVSVGHRHPKVVEAISQQMEKYCYAGAMRCPARAELCNTLASIAPPDINVSFLSSGGSEAVEAALKIAVAYHAATGSLNKYKIISNHDAYHGMTLSTQALCGNAGALGQFDSMVPNGIHIPQYSDVNKPAGMDRDEWGRVCAAELERAIFYQGPHTVAAYIATPVGSGAEYMLLAPQSYWQEIRRICDEYNVLLILDEIVTGMGRTGAWFGSHHLGITPDIMTLAKGLSAGHVPLAATMVSDRVNEPFANGAPLVHGFTFGGNPLGCAAALAVIDVIKSENLVERAARGEQQLLAHKARFLAHPTVADVRVCGLYMALEIVADKNQKGYFEPELNAGGRFREAALRNGLFMYGGLYGPRNPSGFQRGLINYFSPPLIITDEQLDDLIERYLTTLSEWEQEMGVA